MEEDEFKKRVRRDCLTIEDVKKMKKGEKVLLATVDRNFGDYISNAIASGKIVPGTPYSAEKFFHLAETMNEYTHEDGVRGWLHFECEPKRFGRFPIPSEVQSDKLVSAELFGTVAV
jgi:hypothetical protein